MSAMASQITSLTIFYLTVYSGTDESKHQSSTLLAFVQGFHRWPVISAHKGPVTRKMLPFDNIIMAIKIFVLSSWNIVTACVVKIRSVCGWYRDEFFVLWHLPIIDNFGKKR